MNTKYLPLFKLCEIVLIPSLISEVIFTSTALHIIESAVFTKAIGGPYLESSNSIRH